MTLAVVGALTALAGCGGNGGGGGGGGGRSGGTAAAVPSPTTPAPPAARRYRPPATPFTRGSGREIGATARTRYAERTFTPLPPSFVPGGIAIGSRAGRCHVPEPTAADAFALRAAMERQTARGTLQPLTEADVLLADCGAAGRWALVTWTQVVDGRTTDWIDDMREQDGSWSGTARGVLPGCRPPRDAAAVWQVDVTDCAPPPPARRRAAPRPRGRERLPFGSSKA